MINRIEYMRRQRDNLTSERGTMKWINIVKGSKGISLYGEAEHRREKFGGEILAINPKLVKAQFGFLTN